MASQLRRSDIAWTMPPRRGLSRLWVGSFLQVFRSYGAGPPTANALLLVEDDTAALRFMLAGIGAAS
jgi:hypothetical protein